MSTSKRCVPLGGFPIATLVLIGVLAPVGLAQEVLPIEIEEAEPRPSAVLLSSFPDSIPASPSGPLFDRRLLRSDVQEHQNFLIADFDNDSHDDLMILDGERLAVYAATPRGFEKLYESEIPLSNKRVAVGTGDFDGDGWTDVLLDKFVLWNDGGFFEQASGQTGPNNTLVWHARDFDGDGNDDIITTDSDNFPSVTRIWVWFGDADRSIDENPTFYEIPGSEASEQRSLFADTDGDGDSDLFGAFAWRDGVPTEQPFIIANLGNGQLEYRPFPGIFVYSVLAVGDIDSDGKEEVVFAGNRNAVPTLFVMGSPSQDVFEIEAEYPIVVKVNHGPVGTMAQVAGRSAPDIWTEFGVYRNNAPESFSYEPLPGGPYPDMTFVDMNRDGRVDVLVGLHPLQAYFTNFMALMDTGEGPFHPSFAGDLLDPVTEDYIQLTPLSPGELGLPKYYVEDLIDDPSMKSSGRYRVYRLNEDLSFEFVSFLGGQSTFSIRTLALFDMDGDGRPDLLSDRRLVNTEPEREIMWQRQLDNGQFGELQYVAPAVTSGLNPTSKTLDFYHDNRLFYPRFRTNFESQGYQLELIEYSLLNGTVIHEPIPLHTWQTANQETIPTTLDLNSDGHMDFVYPISGGLKAYFGEPDGTFTAGLLISPAQWVSGSPVVFDLDQDGDDDLLVTAADSDLGNQTYIVRNNATRFPPVELIGELLPAGDPRIERADLDADGREDLFMINDLDVAMVIRTRDLPGAATRAAESYWLPYRDGTLVDVNSDGLPDLTVLVQDSVNDVPKRAYATLNRLCRADVNGDGFVDLGDIGSLVGLFLSGDSAADFNQDGVLDLSDLTTFIQVFLAGC